MQLRLSPSSIRAFRTCPQKFRLSYLANLDSDRDEEALRIGGAWAKCHEHYKLALRNPISKTDALNEVLQLLDKLYINIPPNIDPKVWEAEREMIHRSFAVYQDVYANSQLTSLAVEDRHVFPLFNPHTGLPIPESEAVCVIKVDEIVRDEPPVDQPSNWRPYILEMKSTSRDIAPGSDYWQSLRLDIQVSFYNFWSRQMWEVNTPVIYDVWRKPLLRLKKDESVAEYADRVEAKLRENPPDHFQRHQIARTDKDMEQFQLELWNCYQAMKAMIQRDGFYSNESQCITITGSCPYKKICFNEGADKVVRENLVPLGFKKRPPLADVKVDE
jgi:PD-(D/E)XK nuclease superfamily